MTCVAVNRPPVTLPDFLEPGEPGTALVWLVDNEKAYGAIATAIAGAQHSIAISQLALDADFAGPPLPGCDHDSASPFIELLLDAVRKRDVNVRILLNTTRLLDTLKPLRRFLATQSIRGERLQMRGLGHFPQLLHAKIVVVDSKVAFLVGSPFVKGYWDSSEHSPVDSTRPTRELGGRPLHDVSVQIFGASVAGIEKLYEQLWAAGIGDGNDRSAKPAPHDHRPPAATAARISTTVPEGITSFGSGSTGILRTLKGALRRATSVIYLEQQYLSSRRVIAELRRALERHTELEIIVVSNQNPDVTAYAQWQVAALRDFKMLDHPRVGLFALWSGVQMESRREINQVFVHSKVVIVDDKWAMCGSANLDGVSLHSYGADFAGVVGQRVFRNVRNFDVAVSIDAVDEIDSPCSARILRDELWSEHLGCGFNPRSTRPANGWLALWRATASRNIELLNSGSMPREGSFVLPYSCSTKPVLQLLGCGIDLQQSDLHLQFNPGWFERQYGLGWVRNMFL